MTRKKSRPQHRENVSSKSVNEGGFYKMFWDNLDGDEATDASPQSPDVVPRNSPSLIIINDSDDENPNTIDESSGDILGIPLPIKEELLLETNTGNKEHSEGQSCNMPSEVIPRNSPSVIVINDSDDENPYTIDERSGDSLETPLPIKQELSLETQTSAANKDQNADQSGDFPSEKTIEDGVISSLQPTSLGHSSSASPCDASINSLPLVSDQRTLSEGLRSPILTNSPEKSRSVSQDPIETTATLFWHIPWIIVNI
uniref:Uncharacterized protein n=1 Tax=Lygus hesperus TaxID=30085 RepID=A0A0K8T1J4_LYGHE